MATKQFKRNGSQPKVRYKMHVKKGDTVQVIAGRDKGKLVKLKAIPEESRVIVKGS
jgi:large subunit ribosomal protein L24